MVPAFILVSWLFGVDVVQAACEEPSTRTEIGLTVAGAMEGFKSLDALRFEASRDKAFAELYCLSEPLMPRDAARFHAMMAVDAFLKKDEASTIASFKAALSADRTYDLPPGMVPEGHLLLKRLATARERPSAPPRPLPTIGPDRIVVDGAPSSIAPSDRPVLLQRVSEKGEAQETLYLAAGAPLPAWTPPVAVIPPKTKPKKEPKPVVKRDPHPWGLAGATALSLAVAGTSYAFASSAHATFLDPATPYGDLAGLKTRANAFSWTWIGSGAVTFGLGTWTVVKW